MNLKSAEDEITVFCPKCDCEMTWRYSYSMENDDPAILNGLYCEDCDFEMDAKLNGGYE